MSTNKNSIHILRGTKPGVNSTTLYDGQLYFDRGTKTLQVGDKSNSTIGNNNNYVTVKDGAINDAKVASDAAIKGSKLADANNTSSPSGITTSKIENSAITTAKVENNAITAEKLNNIIAIGSSTNNNITVSLQQNSETNKLEIGVSGDTVNNATNVSTKIKNIAIDNIFSTSGNTLIPKYPKFESKNYNLYITTKP